MEKTQEKTQEKTTYKNQCNICAVETASFVRCNLCVEAACRDCITRYLLGTSQEIHCMFCRKQWTQEFAETNFTKKFVHTTLRKHYENLWLAKEKVYLPLAMEHLEEHRRELNRLTKRRTFIVRRNTIKKQLQEFVTDLDDISNRRKYNSHKEELFQVSYSIKQKYGFNKAMEYVIKSMQLYFVNCDIKDRDINEASSSKISKGAQSSLGITKAVVVRHCPVDGCRGFIMSGTLACGICAMKVCRHCNFALGKQQPEQDNENENQDKQDEKKHVCKKEDVESFNLIQKETKPCPKCGVRIYKTEGCDQMWCIKCHTTFSWRTGKVETGIVHNPHFYEWARRNNVNTRNPGDVPCGGLPQYLPRFLSMFRSKAIAQTNLEYNSFSSILRAANHIQAVEVRQNIAEPDNMMLRIKYLNNEIDEKEWKRQIFLRKRLYTKHKDLNEINTMFVAVCTDLFRRLERIGESCNENAQEQTHHELDLLLIEFSNLRDYYNATVRSFSEKYNKCAHRILLPNWNICNVVLRPTRRPKILNDKEPLCKDEKTPEHDADDETDWDEE